MKSYILVPIVAATLVSAAPAVNNNTVAGAAFFMTNEPNQNFIIMNQFDQTGKLVSPISL